MPRRFDHRLAPLIPLFHLHLGHPHTAPSSEFYTLLDVAVPGLLGEPAAFRRTYEGPILRGQVRGAERGQVRTRRGGCNKTGSPAHHAPLHRGALPAPR